MYVDRMDLNSGTIGTDGLQGVMQRFAEDSEGAKGFIGHTLLRSYAFPNKFALLRRWDSVEDAWAYEGTDKLARLISGATTHEREIERTRFEGYDVPIELGEIKSASFEQFADWTLSTIAKAGAFEESRHELFALQQAHNPGFVAARLYRSAGVPTKYLMHTMFESKEAARGGGTSPELRAFIAANPAPNFANVSPAIEAYAVVDRG